MVQKCRDGVELFLVDQPGLANGDEIAVVHV